MDAARMRDLGLPVVEHQKIALEKAESELESVRPGSRQELQLALQHDPQTRQAMTELQGPERGGRLVAGMEGERETQLDPNVRAERLVARWNGLEAEHAKLRGWEHRDAQQKVETQMRGVADEIGRDAQVESVLRQKREALGISERSNLGRAVRQVQVGEALGHSLDGGYRQRGQSHGDEM